MSPKYICEDCGDHYKADHIQQDERICSYCCENEAAFEDENGEEICNGCFTRHQVGDPNC